MKIDEYAKMKDKISKLSHKELYKIVSDLALNVNRNFYFIEKKGLTSYSAMYNFYKNKYGDEKAKEQRIKVSKEMSDAELRKIYKIALSTLKPYEYNKSAIGTSVTASGTEKIKEEITKKIFNIEELTENIKDEKEKQEAQKALLEQAEETIKKDINWTEYWRAFNTYKSLEANNAKEQSAKVLQILKDEFVEGNDISDNEKLRERINKILEEQKQKTPPPTGENKEEGVYEISDRADEEDINDGLEARNVF